MFRLLSFFYNYANIICYYCTSGIWIYESGALGTSPDGFVQGDNHKTGITHLK